MLTHLSIKNVGLIEQASVDFLQGFTVISGETGAGKSMFTHALSLGLGARAESGILRHGAESASVDVRFQIAKNHPVLALVEDLGVELEEGELFLRRTLNADKSRAFVCGVQVTQAQLREIGEYLVDLHGQHDGQLLLRSSKHAEMLDGFGRLQKEKEAVSQGFKAWANAHKALEDAKNLLKSRADEEILLTAYIDELQKLSPKKGEEEALTTERKYLLSVEKISLSLNAAMSALSSDVDISGVLGHAESALSGVSDISPELLSLYERASGLRHEVVALVDDIEREGSALDASPERLKEVDDRLFALRDCSRKHGCEMDDLVEKLSELEEKLERLNHLQGDISALEKEEQAKREIFEKSCAVLTKARGVAAKNLSIAIEKSLKNLEMPNTKFEAALQTLPQEQWGENGAEKVEFMVATNVGSPMAPLVKIASGGEVSRLMLALKEVFYADMPETTLIFDEIDTGVSGGVAEAMGLAMKNLANGHQVFSITHLAQVASKGHRHVKISKHTVGESTQTVLTELKGEDRILEVSRMLSGKEITAEAKAVAQKLLAS